MILIQQDYLKEYVKHMEAETRSEKELVLNMRKDIRELYQTKETYVFAQVLFLCNRSCVLSLFHEKQ